MRVRADENRIARPFALTMEGSEMKRTARSTLITAGIAGAMLAGASVAAIAHGDGDGHRARHFDHMLERADTDGDGALSRTEIEAHRDALFAEFDRDDDGQVSRDEMRAGMVDRLFARVDGDGDGMVSRDEFAAMAERMHDGRRHGGSRDDDDRDDDDRHHGYHHGSKGGGHAMLGRGFHRMDRNDDGAVDRDEAARMTERMIERFDDDGDGRITREEMR